MDFVNENKNQVSIEASCEMIGLHPSTYHDVKSRPMSKAATRREKIAELVILSFFDSKRRYGCRRISMDLWIKHGVKASKNLVRRIMRAKGLKVLSAKSFVPATTDSDHQHSISPNLLNREFDKADGPNQRWSGDITYIRTMQGFVYLAIVMDLFSRKIVGISIQNHMKSDLVVEALKHALARRSPDGNLLCHSDRGSQYASQVYRDLLAKYAIVQSMSRKGNCWDNAPVESFFGTLKNECIHHIKLNNLNHTKEVVLDYIYNFYNTNRVHSSLDGLNPVQYENTY